ncbi:MAG: hypothetical protein V1738_04110, partial [Patescibacteria group bacterium]
MRYEILPSLNNPRRIIRSLVTTAVVVSIFLSPLSPALAAEDFVVSAETEVTPVEPSADTFVEPVADVGGFGGRVFTFSITSLVYAK